MKHLIPLKRRSDFAPLLPRAVVAAALGGCIATACLTLPATAAYAQARSADADRATYEDVMQQVRKAQAADPKKAFALLEVQLQRTPDVHPDVWWRYQFSGAELQYDQLHDAKRALLILDAAQERVASDVDAGQAPASRLVSLIGLKGRILVLERREKEAAELIGGKENWPRVLAVAQKESVHQLASAAVAMQMLLGALSPLGRHDEAVAKLRELFQAAPLLLTGTRQGEDGALLERMATELLAQNKPEATTEALSWGKLLFMVAPFNDAGIERATKTLGRVWAANDDWAKIRAFGEAQSKLPDATAKTSEAANGAAAKDAANAPSKDAAVKDATPDKSAAPDNPLRAVALPEMVKAQQGALKERAAQLEGDPAIKADLAQQRDLIGLLILTKQWGKAMRSAQWLLRDNPDSPDGAREIGRVFKAHDLSAARGNLFIAFLNGKGEGTNPVADFLRRYPENAKADAKQ